MAGKDSRKPHWDVWATVQASALATTAGAAATAVAAALGWTSQAAIAPVAIVLAVFTSLAHHWKTQLAEIAGDRARTTRNRFAELKDMVAETQGLVQLTGVGLPYPLPFGGDYALTADAAAVLARQVALTQPQVVVELGSGVSTIMVAKLLHDQGRGRVYSLDHDAGWAALTRQSLDVAGLSEHATVFHAPLVAQEIEGMDFSWYQVPAEVAALREIDLLIVDGPPQKTDPTGLPRYPALPIFLPKLSQKAQIFVDDSRREQEERMVRLWLQRHPGWQATLLNTVPGTYLMCRSPDATPAGSGG